MTRLTLLSVLLLCTLPLLAANQVANPGFEDGFANWHEHRSGDAKAAGTIDRTCVHSGKASFKITNDSAFAPNVYYRIFQHQSVKPKTRYLIGLWSKGVGAGRCWIGGGPIGNWCLKRQLPSGDHDWTWTSVEYTTEPDQTVFELMILTESPTQTLWIDDVYFAPVGPTAEAIVYTPNVKDTITPDLRFYPTMPADSKNSAPVVQVRYKPDPKFGFDAAIKWSPDDLIFEISVLDATRSPVNPGPMMWDSDSIQIGLDIQPEKPKDGMGGSCYELGFALNPAGKVLQHAWYAAGVDPAHWQDLPAEGRRTPEGYHLTIRFPWSRMRLEGAGLPKVLGVNILANDNQTGRRWVEWTYGIGWGVKTPDRFARVVRVTDPASAAYVLFDQKPVYDQKDFVVGTFVQFAAKPLRPETMRLAFANEAGQSVAELGSAKLPAAPAGGCRSFAFLTPAGPLAKEGIYRVQTRAGDAVLADVPVHRIDLSVRLADLIKQNQGRTDAIRAQTKNQPKLAENPYVQSALAVADRFLHRVRTDGPNKDNPQPIDWSMRQMKELAAVLDQTEAFLLAGAVFDSPQPIGGPVEIRDGVFYTQTTAGVRPFFFGGFGHFGTVGAESPTLRKIGYSLIQLESGPTSLWGDNQLDHIAQGRVDAVKLASKNQMKVTFLLSPHYFPEWAISKAPEVVVPGGWLKFDINHPVARWAIERWINCIVPKTKDEPAILSYDLMNEPSYGQSGRTKVSRPLWIEYLKNHHKDIQKLNALYATKYSAFDQVPVPDEYPDAVPARRAYYDWIVFNHKNFADWFQFMHDCVKKTAPKAFTQAKLLDNTFTYKVVGGGVDPELVCNITDIAGNDCWALWPAGDYAFNWIAMELWYDLLHSFRNQPVSNTELHIMPDGTTVGDDVPPQHTAAIYWQGALHHQGSHTTWTWEEPVSEGLKGHIALRPANVFSGARTMLDLNRLAPEIAAINQTKPDAAILFSMPSIFWEKDLEHVTKEAYTQLNFMGLTITFISERQLAAGKIPDVPVILLPHVTHVQDSTVTALDEWHKKGGKLILVGDGNLSFDEYHRNRRLPAGLADLQPINPKQIPAQLQALPRLRLTDLQTNQPAWGVEFRAVPYQNQLLVPIINHLSKPVAVKLAHPGPAVDLITGQTVSPDRIDLKPMQFLLLRFNR